MIGEMVRSGERLQDVTLREQFVTLFVSKPICNTDSSLNLGELTHSNTNTYNETFPLYTINCAADSPMDPGSQLQALHQ